VPEGKLIGQPLILRAWQRRNIKKIYDSPTRTFILSMGRKNGKTAFAAALLLLNLVGVEARPNGQLYSAAQSKDQAALLFGLASKMVRLSPTLDPFVVIRDRVKELFCPRLGTLYCALSAEVKTKYGLSPVFIVHDELGQVRGPRSELYEALETSTGAQEEPLSVIISTQSPTDADLLSVLIDDAKSGADKLIKLSLYTADEELDPFCVRAMRQANPAYGDFLNAAQVKKQAEDARRMPSQEAGYRNLILNQRTSQAVIFVARRPWEACASEPLAETFASRVVWAGLDLSARNDLTALVFAAQDELGVWDVRPMFFAPQVGLIERAKRDRVPYDLWAREGLIMLSPGASVDYDFVVDHLLCQVDALDLRGIAFDRWRIDVLKAAVARRARELPLTPFGQGFKDMSPALDTFEAELVSHRVRHGGHAVLTWCASNAIATRDAAGNRKLDKSRATGRIDGLVALVMAMGAATRAVEGEGQTRIGGDYEVLVA
jgi:phage terminase large subunit-like protein